MQTECNRRIRRCAYTMKTSCFCIKHCGLTFGHDLGRGKNSGYGIGYDLDGNFRPKFYMEYLRCAYDPAVLEARQCDLWIREAQNKTESSLLGMA
jgi:hypothetical protein